MSFNWSDYLILTQNLAGKTSLPCQEAKLRTAISRAYYGAYCSTKNYLLAKGWDIPKSGEAHKLVRETLTKLGQPFNQIGSDLARLWKDRKYADYEDQFPVALDKTAALDVILAQRIINDLARI
ncbi:MAG: HEPN domain-containing protein [Candidatus Zixiibacteriota bacterium]